MILICFFLIGIDRFSMFQYQKLGNLLQLIIENKRQIKSALYSPNYEEKKLTASLNVRATYSLFSTILNNMQLFSESRKRIQQHLESQINNPYLFFVMVGQAINTGKIKGGGKLKKIIMQNKQLWPKVQKNSKINKQNVQIRLRSTSDQFEHWNDILSLPENEAQKVPIIQNMYTIKAESYSKLVSKYPSILNSRACVIQSFSSALPAFLVMSAIRQKSEIFQPFDLIDACSAPGNKTIQLSEYAGSQRTVFAFQKSSSRVQILSKNIQRYQAQNVKISHSDFLMNKPKDFKKVKIILLDPSCSGSGMLVNFQRDSQPNGKDMENQAGQKQFQTFCQKRFENLPFDQKQRICKLHAFQLSLLHHAAKFNPVRISYSTCSIYHQENQFVVRQFMKSHPQYTIKANKEVKFQEKMSLKRGFGQDMQNCIRVDPRDRKSDGFFVCIFKRNSK